MFRYSPKLQTIEEKENLNTDNKPIKFEDHTKGGRNSTSPTGLNQLVKSMKLFNKPKIFKVAYDWDDIVLTKPIPRKSK